jgi:signal transduction histidine kinase
VATRGVGGNRALDEKLVRHTLTNLLTNALKYSPAPAPVDFEVEGSREAVTFLVRDRGIGVPADDQPRLFESFHRARNVGNVEGTGLGLTIVKQCVELHGGTVDFESRAGEGTTFIVCLPGALA